MQQVLITGVNPNGLGAATAYAIASQNPSLLILTYRTEEKVKEVLERLRGTYPSVRTAILHLDLENLDSVRIAATEVRSLTNHIDVLINNAGVMMVQDRTLTTSGIEIQFATNHVGHFLFTNLIIDMLVTAAQNAARPGLTRIINISGGWHQFSPVRFDDINFSGKDVPEDQKPATDLLAYFGFEFNGAYSPAVAYSQSKTANILFSTYLTQHLANAGILSLAVNPGGESMHITAFGCIGWDELGLMAFDRYFD